MVTKVASQSVYSVTTSVEQALTVCLPVCQSCSQSDSRTVSESVSHLVGLLASWSISGRVVWNKALRGFFFFINFLIEFQNFIVQLSLGLKCVAI